MRKLPSRIELVEVGPRDGFQSLAAYIPAADKLRVIRALLAAGVRRMEITSFVHPKAIPQMIDAEAVAQGALAQAPPGFAPIALVPNLAGAKRAWQAGLREVSYVASVSPAHNEANIRRSHAQSFEELRRIRSELPQLRIRFDAATAFGCPFLGEIAPGQTLAFLERAVACGVDACILCDTIGVADPRQVRALALQAQRAFPQTRFGLHLHDTRGLGLANILAGLEAGVAVIETAVGGLGGCPFAPGASGNTATEDLLYLLRRLGVDTGVDFDRYLEAVELTRKIVRTPLASRLSVVPRDSAAACRPRVGTSDAPPRCESRE